MKFSALLALGIVIVNGLTACSKSSSKEHHVILISLDGFPAWMWNDPSLQVPNLRKLAADGASTKAMTVSNPSITWINHTTLVTGVEPRKHGVLFNGLLVRQEGNKPAKIEPWVDKSKLVHVPTLYDIAHQSGLTTAESDWVAVTRPGTITRPRSYLVTPVAYRVGVPGMLWGLSLGYTSAEGSLAAPVPAEL